MPGKQLVVADTLSRHPLTHNGESDIEDDVKVFLQAVLSTRPLSDDQLNAIKKPQNKIQISRWYASTFVMAAHIKYHICSMGFTL